MIAVTEALGELKGQRRGRWSIGPALVEGAASEPVETRLPWLELARECRTPSSKGERQAPEAYEVALDQVVVGADAQIDAIVTRT